MKKIIIGIVVVFLILVLYRVFNLKKTEDKAVRKLTSVRVAPVKKGPVENKIYYQGKVLGKKQASLKSSFTLKVEKILVQTGETVKKGQRIIKLDNSSLLEQYKSSRAQLAASEEKFKAAEAEFKRQEELFEKKAISEKAYQSASSQFESSKSSLAAARSGLISSKKKYDDSFLVSPFKGVVTALDAQIGQEVSPGQVIAVITDTSSWRVRADVTPTHMHRIRKGNDALIVTQANDTLMGSVSHVDQGVDPDIGKGVAEVVFKNQEKKLIPGTWAEVYFITKTKDNVLRVPSYSLIEETKISNVNEGGSLIGFEKYYKVAVVEKDTVKIKTIATGIEDVRWVEVIDGVNPDDLLIIEGQRRVRNNEPVKIVQ